MYRPCKIQCMVQEPLKLVSTSLRCLIGLRTRARKKTQRKGRWNVCPRTHQPLKDQHHDLTSLFLLSFLSLPALTLVNTVLPLCRDLAISWHTLTVPPCDIINNRTLTSVFVTYTFIWHELDFFFFYLISNVIFDIISCGQMSTRFIIKR